MNENILNCNDTLIYKNKGMMQCMYIRDGLNGLILRMCGLNFSNYKVEVVSTHTSKSVKLPVYKLELKGFTFYLRCNFHDWKISVIAPYPTDINFENLFGIDDKINPIYCEGFDKSWVFGSYKDSSKQFTISLEKEEELWFFFRKIFYTVEYR